MRNYETLFSWGFLFLAAFIDCVTICTVKWRSNAVGPFKFQSFSSAVKYGLTFLQHPVVLLAILGFFAGPFFGYIALTRLNVSDAYPVNVVLHLLLVTGFGFILLHEPFELSQLIGLGFMVIGLAFYFKKVAV